MNWIDAFLQQTATIPSPEIFRRWAALSTISAALQRRAYLVVRGEKLFCNLFVLLVGPPGVGKTRAIRLGQELLRPHSHIKLLPQKTSSSKVIGAIINSFSTYTYEAELFSQCSVSGFFDEIANFIEPKDFSFMAQLTDWYDCPKVWTYDTRARGEEKAENIYLSFIGGITPRMLANILGPNAFGMGFTSRLNIVFSEDHVETDPFEAHGEINLEPLKRQVDKFANFCGEFTISPEGKDVVRQWIVEGMRPLPVDSRFAEYNPRRWLHWLKLAMLYTVSRESDHIEAQDLFLAKQTLLEAEFVMPLALEYLGQNPMAEAVKNVHMWAMTTYITNKRTPIHESQLLRKLMTDVPQQYHQITIEHMVSSGMLVHTSGSAPNRQFIPRAIDRIH
jgi:energy-coupling factor transporter ATP-binding protein EcfA2